MTPTNEQELKELAELREYVNELEEGVLKSFEHIDTRLDTFYCCLCDAESRQNIMHHKPDCIVTKIRNRRGL